MADWLYSREKPSEWPRRTTAQAVPILPPAHLLGRRSLLRGFPARLGRFSAQNGVVGGRGCSGSPSGGSRTPASGLRASPAGSHLNACQLSAALQIIGQRPPRNPPPSRSQRPPPGRTRAPRQTSGLPGGSPDLPPDCMPLLTGMPLRRGGGKEVKRMVASAQGCLPKNLQKTHKGVRTRKLVGRVLLEPAFLGHYLALSLGLSLTLKIPKCPPLPCTGCEGFHHPLEVTWWSR